MQDHYYAYAIHEKIGMLSEARDSPKLDSLSKDAAIAYEEKFNPASFFQEKYLLTKEKVKLDVVEQAGCN